MRWTEQLQTLLNMPTCIWRVESAATHGDRVADVGICCIHNMLSVASVYVRLHIGRMPHLRELRQHHVRHLLVLVIVAGQPCQVVPEFFLSIVIAATRVSVVAAVIIAALAILPWTQTHDLSGSSALNSLPHPLYMVASAVVADFQHLVML